MSEDKEKTKTPPITGAQNPPEVTTPSVIKIGDKEYSMAELEKLVSGQKTAISQVLPDETAPAGEMLLAEVSVQTNQLGSTLPLRDVTPSELMFLAAQYATHSGGRPIKSLALEQVEVQEPIREKHEEGYVNGVLVPAREVVVGYKTVKTGKRKTVKRTPVEERNRLISKYGKVRITAAFPGAIPQLPGTYKEALNVGLTTELPEGPEKSGSVIAEKDIAKT